MIHLSNDEIWEVLRSSSKPYNPEDDLKQLNKFIEDKYNILRESKSDVVAIDVDSIPTYLDSIEFLKAVVGERLSNSLTRPHYLILVSKSNEESSHILNAVKLISKLQHTPLVVWEEYAQGVCKPVIHNSVHLSTSSNDLIESIYKMMSKQDNYHGEFDAEAVARYRANGGDVKQGDLSGVGTKLKLLSTNHPNLISRISRPSVTEKNGKTFKNTYCLAHPTNSPL